MFNAVTELLLLKKEIKCLLDDNLFQEIADAPCSSGCGTPWPRSRLHLARPCAKFSRPLLRTVGFCECDLWVPPATGSATFELELSCIRHFCFRLFKRAVESLPPAISSEHG